jgi:glucokinase
VESRCSGWVVDARIRAVKLTDPASVLAKLAEGHAGGEAAHLADALAQNDLAAQRILREMAEDLAFGLSHVAHLFHPEKIVIGGGLANVGEPLRVAVASALKTFVMGVFASGPKICLAALRADAVPLGALELARRGIASG